MANIFQQLAPTRVDSNTFDLSYDLKLSLDMGRLIPIHCQDIFPGDKITHNCESLLRFAPLIAPVMHKIDVWQHFFFVPNRLLWSGWEDFITGKPDAPAHPYYAGMTVATGSVGDYLGAPIATIDKISALPFAAYQMIYNEYFRDENLSTEIVGVPLQDGDNSIFAVAHNTIRRRAWEHDYFTSALPWAQKGDPVTIPLGDFNNVNVSLKSTLTTTAGIVTNNGSVLDAGNMTAGVSGFAYGTLNDSNGTPVNYDPNGTLQANTADLEASGTINDLRRAIKLQEFLEKNARGGTRYIESIAVHFGVRSSDARLQRPQYLGGSKQPMVISEVLQTSATGPTDDDTPQGNMAGHGVSVGSGRQFTFHAEEHGYIIGIMSILPKTAYQQGLPRHFHKFDYLDYPWPSFAHLGEQEVKNREIYYQGDLVGGNATFGYQPRYTEYKYNPSRVAGEFRTSLAYWHLGRIFNSMPALNQEFIECNPSTRIFAVEDAEVYDTVYAHVFHRITANRKLPKYAQT